jgi:hypothetical protein
MGRKSSQELGLEKSVSFFLLIVYTPTAVIGLGRWEFTVTLTYMRRAGPARWCMMYVGVDYCVLPFFFFDVTYLLDLLYHTNRSVWEGMEWIGSCVCSLILLRLEYLILRGVSDSHHGRSKGSLHRTQWSFWGPSEY